MAIKKDRVGELLEGVKRKRHIIVSPEGVPLEVQIASRGERCMAFVLDITIMLVPTIILYIFFAYLFFSNSNLIILRTLVAFVVFLVRVLYFMHFELAWQGRTPGKKLLRLQVISRSGGELAPSAIIARNLMREIEFFLPFSLLFYSSIHFDTQQFVSLGWILVISLLPLFNRANLRAGDIIGGTMVIALPQHALLEDLSYEARQNTASPGENTYNFTPEQLAVYGTFELQVLEELLRRKRTPDNEKLLADVCRKICNKIQWPDSISPHDVRRFLTDFYIAERADLERGQLFGRTKEDKNSEVKGPGSAN